ncbi:MAG: AAA family ATPase [Phycisphaerae bacterium]
MYAEFFGLRELPFNNTPDPRFFYSTPDHEEAMASLIYAVQERKGFVLLTGEIGAGKTLVSRMMLRHFGSRIAFAAINHAVQDAADLMESVCAEFDIRFPSGASNAQLVRSLQDFLLGQFAHDTPVVLVLDEAQNLTIDAFEQLRMVGNLEADDAKLLQIIIVGQPELQRTFASRELRQLRQRVFRSFHLPALSQASTAGYIQHRLTVAGGDPATIMTREAMDRVFELSSGLPRLINTLCDNALLSAYSSQQRRVGRELIDAAAEQTPELGEPTEPQRPAAACGQAPGQAPAPARVPVPRPAGARAGGQASRAPARPPAAARPAPAPPPPATPQCRPVAGRPTSLDAPAASAGKRGDQGDSARGAVHALVRQARLAEAALRPIVSQALDATRRADATLQGLQHSETQGRQLAAKLKTLLDNTRRILEGLKWTAGRIRRGEQSALDTLKRLETRTRHSQKLADELGHAFSDMVRSERRPAKAGFKSVVVSKPAADVLAAATSPRGLGPEATLDGALDSTRRSLSDLRTLVRDGAAERGLPAARDPRRVAAGNEPIARLQRDVEELVELIGRD